jgi:ankyrin repeat protein
MRRIVRIVAAAVLLAPVLAGPAARAELDISPRKPALIAAVVANDVDKVRISLLQKKENPNAVDDRDARTALMFAAANGNTEIVKLLLDAGAKINATDSAGSTALHWAADRGQADVVRQLLAARAPVDLETKRGLTPLMLAATSGNAEIVDVLLAAGADPKRQDFTGRSALDYAQAKRQPAVIQKLQAAAKR